ncbi:DUF6966 domain-containing protein [Epibacterium ulvae]|uniref:DUF6966 domain-containing protein n=1 Tax=Epibacterium ulvae TaxID=1156985 RepID=UPI0024915376|nr:hypothetical protein [Epibacterium ulvae]
MTVFCNTENVCNEVIALFALLIDFWSIGKMGLQNNHEAAFLRLEGLLEIILSDLRSAPPTHWTNWMRVALKYIKRRDLAGVRFFLSAHGGMGSFNDWAPLSADGWKADDEARTLARSLSHKNVFDSGCNLISEHRETLAR